ncbi:MAG: hypothetical protein KGI90_04080 [Burkholderiales bacterium]|nr:hypothetical protein [Burkholderiales bacterium]MDE2277745.1 hypothetical protein [Burkholderiales bacterium]
MQRLQSLFSKSFNTKTAQAAEQRRPQPLDAASLKRVSGGTSVPEPLPRVG